MISRVNSPPPQKKKKKYQISILNFETVLDMLYLK